MKKTTFVSFLLDETGSMEPIKDDTIGGFNHYVKELAGSGEEIVFSLVKFDSNHQTVVHSAVPIGEVPELTPQTYRPGAATPLIDAAVKLIRATEEKVKTHDDEPQVSVVIQTDGYENASVEFKNEDLHGLVQEKTQQGWLFTFLGAGIDAFDQAQKWGISAATTLSYDRAASPQAFASVGRSTVTYAQTGSHSAAAFTPQERASTAVPPQQAQPSPVSKPEEPAPIVKDFSL